MDTNIKELKNLKDYYEYIADGKIPNKSSVFKFGAGTIGVTESIVWDGGDGMDLLPFGQAERLSIVSTSTDDNSAGIGARTYMVYGLDIDGKLQSEVVSLNGTTPVLTVNSYWRNWRAFVVTSGGTNIVSANNIGDISATLETSGHLQSRVKAGIGKTLMAFYTVPKDYKMKVTGISMSVGQGKECLFKAKVRPSGLATTTEFTRDLYQNTYDGILKIPLVIPELADVFITGITTSGTVAASASWGAILEKIT